MTNIPINNLKDQFKSSIINQTEADQRAAEEQVADIKASINNQESVSAAELAAQKDAIKEEVAEHHLADTSPNAQQSQQDVSATQKSSDEESNVAELETKHIDASKEPSQSEVAANKKRLKMRHRVRRIIMLQLHHNLKRVPIIMAQKLRQLQVVQLLQLESQKRQLIRMIKLTTMRKQQTEQMN